MTRGTKKPRAWEDVPLFTAPDGPIRARPKRRKGAPAERLWTGNKALLIERYLYYFVLVTKHGTYIDGFAGPQDAGRPESWAARLVLESEPKRLRHFHLCELDPRKVEMLKDEEGCQDVIPPGLPEWFDGLAEYVEGLPSDDPRLGTAAAHLAPFLDDDPNVDGGAMYYGGEAVMYLERHWGEAHDGFLSGFLAALCRDFAAWSAGGFRLSN